MSSQIRNLEYIRNIPDIGQRLYETITDIVHQQNNLSVQMNGNPAGKVTSPPSIQSLNVTGSDGIFDAKIEHDGDFYRGVKYYIEHADNENFTNSHVIDLGTTRNFRANLGKGSRYFKAYAAYPGSPAGSAVFHGGDRPKVVDGSVSTSGGTGPAYQDAQGSGTGYPGQGNQGPGPVIYRSKTGARPIRNANSTDKSE